MATTETRTGPTPNGGVRSEAMYQDATGNPVDKLQARYIEILEFDTHGTVVARTYLSIPGSGAVPDVEDVT